MKNPLTTGSFWRRLLFNLLLMIAVALIVGWIVFAWLDVWTGHDKNAIVPQVEGMLCHEAEQALKAEGFHVEIADSVYDNTARPGQVVDQNPRQNTVVKPGRLIYLTVNATAPKTVAIPKLTDISNRQARAILEGIGIANISETRVDSEFKDLVIHVTCNGVPLRPGTRVPVTARITLEVGDGRPAYDDDAELDFDIVDEP